MKMPSTQVILGLATSLDIEIEQLDMKMAPWWFERRNQHRATSELQGKGKETHGLQMEKEIARAQAGTSTMVQEV